MREHRIIPYPEPEEDKIQLGSRVGLRINNGVVFRVDIVGYRGREFQNDDVDQVHHEASPAQAVLGRIAGEKSVAIIGDTEKELEIVNVNQVAIRQHYAQGTDR